jgi:hypothetical protein
VRAAALLAEESEPDFSDDEDYLHHDELRKRHEKEERKRHRESEERCICDNGARAGCGIHGVRGNSRSFFQYGAALQEHEDSEEDEEESEEDAEVWTTEMPPPLPQAPAPTPKAPPAAPSMAAPSVLASPSNTSELMSSAVREAFLQGIEQGKKMQLPMQCKTCAIRKERNRVAAKESRQKKRREAEGVQLRQQIRAAAEFAASRAAPAPSPMAPVASVAAGAGAGVGAMTGEIEGDLVPPPF